MPLLSDAAVILLAQSQYELEMGNFWIVPLLRSVSGMCVVPVRFILYVLVCPLTGGVVTAVRPVTFGD